VGRVPPLSSLDRVIVVPRNGYANRLQAWASSAILAAQVDASLEVCWEPEAAAAAPASALFAPFLVDGQFITEPELASQVGTTPADIPRYLTLHAERGLITLAGHDRGEQVFMPELVDLLGHPCSPRTLVIVAGGKFHLPGTGDFVTQRRVFYQGLAWSPEIDAGVTDALAQRPSFSALHVRQTDRSSEAPPRHAITRGLRALAATAAPRSLFIAADTNEGREQWQRTSAALGFEPWTRVHVDLDRADPRAGVDALVDWRLLSCADAIVHPRASTFSEEAAVASGHHERAIPLIASPARQRVRHATALARSAATYPRRHWGP
jgi:hypothetical protein